MQMEIITKNGKWEIVKNETGNYNCKYYEYFGSINEYRLVDTELNCTKEYVEKSFDVTLEF